LAATPHFNFQYIPKPSALTSGQWAGNATLTETWRSHIGGGVESEYLSPSWTLCYEEQFYVVCGLLILFMPRRFFSGALGVSILTAGTFALSVALPSFHILGFFFDGKWLMFASGVMVYYVLNYCAASARVISGVLLALGIVVARMLSKYLVAHGITDKLVDDPYSWWTAFAFALAILVLRPFDGWICGNRLFTPIAFCGRMCYSLYLIHWPVCKIVGNLLLIAGVRGDLLVLLVTMPVVTAVSILAGWIFHQLVERHFLNPPAVLAPPFPRRQAFSEPELSVAI
jgi:peptidoglycan/LPS O-acetylase OafA/YrhL